MEKPGHDIDADFESIKREIEEFFRAASQRGAECAGKAARELHLDKLADRFFAEAASLERNRPDDEEKGGD